MPTGAAGQGASMPEENTPGTVTHPESPSTVPMTSRRCPVRILNYAAEAAALIACRRRAFRLGPGNGLWPAPNLHDELAKDGADFAGEPLADGLGRLGERPRFLQEMIRLMAQSCSIRTLNMIRCPRYRGSSINRPAAAFSCVFA